eukprot:scaffold3808_cov112-Isochrysis_galbana.AAC.7
MRNARRMHEGDAPERHVADADGGRHHHETGPKTSPSTQRRRGLDAGVNARPRERLWHLLALHNAHHSGKTPPPPSTQIRVFFRLFSPCSMTYLLCAHVSVGCLLTSIHQVTGLLHQDGVGRGVIAAPAVSMLYTCNATLLPSWWRATPVLLPVVYAAPTRTRGMNLLLLMLF